jgi:epoxyqueuosine reductase
MQGLWVTQKREILIVNQEKCSAGDWLVSKIEDIIESFWRTADTNSLHLEHDEKAWERPGVAVAAGDDPLFTRMKELIGPFYWTPMEAYTLAFSNSTARVEDLRVISYVLPQTEETRNDQRQEKELPSERWARSRFHGEEFNCDLRLHLAETLTKSGFPAVAPERLPDFAYQTSEHFGIASNWSERHAAFVAGHGTFGLSDGLITRWGKAVRFGSVVAKIDLPVTKRPYGDDHQAWCLWYAQGKCGACVRRCPIDAITTDEGHDKQACLSYIRNVTTPYVEEAYGTGATPCGLCQVKIPCEDRIPASLVP